MVTISDGGLVTFRVYLPHAGCVELIGEFTAWQDAPVVMKREGEGWWSAELEIAGGEYRFSYLVDGMYWMPDYAASGVEHNAHGKWVSRLEVPAGGVERGTVRLGRVRAGLAAEAAAAEAEAPARSFPGWEEIAGEDRILTQP